jgi:hypothetical protein
MTYGQWGLFATLDHHRVADDKRGSDFACQEEKRDIPRDYGSHDTVWLAQCQVEKPRSLHTYGRRYFL